ncbi:MAG: hypothetical protein H0W64_04540 [Gammaproteobacteria bacterium]|nr:hypothetical protein [Gammaproteobacteria bacterium]
MRNFFYVIFIYALSTQAFAFHGSHFKILNSTIRSTTNARGTFINLPRVFRIHENDDYPASRAFSRTNNLTGHTGTPVKLRGVHEVYITNETQQKQIFEYRQGLYFQQHKIERITLIELEPKGEFSDESESEMEVTPLERGQYPFVVETDFRGIYNAHVEAHGKLAISD